jgi:hypothetical protein
LSKLKHRLQTLFLLAKPFDQGFALARLTCFAGRRPILRRRRFAGLLRVSTRFGGITHEGRVLIPRARLRVGDFQFGLQEGDTAFDMLAGIAAEPAHTAWTTALSAVTATTFTGTIEARFVRVGERVEAV